MSTAAVDGRSPAPPVASAPPAGHCRTAGGYCVRRGHQWRGALVVVAAYLVTRLARLDALPMASDEGTYLTWGVRALHAQSFQDWLASLEDGKQPLLAWLMPPFLALVPDRLLAGRLVSVLAGLANVALVAQLGRRLYGTAAGWTAAALYVVAPIALVHDRMALYDSLVTTTALLVLWAALAWADRPGWPRTLWLGLAMGMALLTKLSALFFVGLVPVAIVLWRPAALRRWWLLTQAYFLAAATYSVLYLSPLVGNIQEGNFQRYSLTAGEVLRLPLGLWRQNAAFIAEAAVVYLGWPLALLAAVALGYGIAAGARRERIAALWALAPLLGFVLTAKIMYSRYVVFCFVAALLPAARLLVTPAGLQVRRGAGRWWPAAAWTAAAVPGVVFAVRLLADPAAAPWMNDPRFITDRFQYVESNYAGYGLREVVAYLREQATHRPIVVLTRSTTGMPRDGVTAYLLDWPNVHVGLVQEHESIEQRLSRQPDRAYLLAAQGADLYYVLSDAPDGEQERRFRSLNGGLSPLLEIPKPGNHSRFQLYKVPWLASTDDRWLEPPPRLGGQIVLRGFRLAAATIPAGGTLRLTLYWEARARPAKDYTVFNHLVDADGRIWGQQDGQPAGGRFPTSRWRPQDAAGDVHDIPIRPDTPAGTYDLLTGMYDLRTMRPLAVEHEGQPQPDRVVLARIAVVPP